MIDRVRVMTPRGPVTIAWDERDQLLQRLRHLIRPFEDVGASRPVELDNRGRATLLAVLEHWHEPLSPRLSLLRDALDRH